MGRFLDEPKVQTSVIPKRKGRFLDEPSQKPSEFGEIRRTPNPLERISQRLSSPATRPISPITPSEVVLNPLGSLARASVSASGIPEEDTLPAIGQAVGGMASGFTGAGLLGATAGATAGQGLRQLAKKTRGQDVDLSAIPKEAAITGLIEGTTRGAGGLILRRQFAKEALSKLGSKLGSMKQALSANPELGIDSETVYMPLKESMEGIAVPHGQQATIINKWLRFMEKNPRLSAKNLIEMEKDLGEVAKFGEFEKGAFVAPTIKKPALNTAAKTSRSQVSGIVDDMAEKSGQKGFKKTSSKISKLLSDPDKTDVTKTSGNLVSRVLAGTAAGGMTMNPLVGLATYYGLQGLQSPLLRNTAFKALRSGPGRLASKAGRVALSELARSATNQ